MTKAAVKNGCQNRPRAIALEYSMGSFLLASALGLFSGLAANAKDKPIPVKVVVITMYERGAARNAYESANARRPPFVLKGDTLPSGTFWHGKLLNQWAEDWVRYHTGDKGEFTTTAMEDTGPCNRSLFWPKPAVRT